jgi:hypothetical protein
MGANSSKRRRQEATPIDLDAMFDDSSLNGLESAIRLMFDPDALPPVGTRSDTAPPTIVETPATPTMRKPPSLEVNGLAAVTVARPTGDGTESIGESLPSVDAFNMSTDDKSPMSTVDICNLSTVDNNSYQQSNKGVDSEELEQLSTVDISADFRLTPAEVADVSTVDIFNLSTVDGYTLFSDLEERQIFDARRVRRIGIVQDALSKAEFNYYKALWDASGEDFNVLQKNEHGKVFQAGYMTIAKLLVVDKRHVPRLIDALRSKLALEVQESGKSVAGEGRLCATYRLYSFREILNRVKQAGYTHAKQLGKSVHLVKPFTKLFTVDKLQMSTVDSSKISTVDKLDKCPPWQNVHGGKMSTVTVDKYGPASLLGFISLKDDDDGAVEIIERQLVATEFAAFDRQAIARIWRESREAVPDVTPDEVRQIFLEKARSLSRNRRIENPNGLILHMWKSWLTPVRIEQIRRGEQLKSEEQDSQTKWRQEQMDALSDPAVSEDEKRLIRTCLGLNTP